MSKRVEAHKEFMDIGRKELESIDLNTCRSLSPHISLVGTLHSNKWKNNKTKNKESIESARVIGYRFKTDVDISDITKFDINARSYVITTDPMGYTKNGTFSVKAGSEFDLNLFETAVFFMRDDIFGEIYGGETAVNIYTLITSKDYPTIALKMKSNTKCIKDNEIYVDYIEDGEIVPKEGFDKFSIIYDRRSRRKSKVPAYKEDKSAITVCSLRSILKDVI